jgi:predicted acetyltransferase
MELVQGTRDHLASYVAALRAGWSADNVRGAAAAQEELHRIEADPDAFLASLYDPEARGPLVTLPDGSRVRRIPGYRKWMWDGEFCGSIGLRWMPGTQELPDHVLGHVGYAVVPWKQGRGYAKQSLVAIAAEARALGLEYIEMTTDPDNIASQRVMLASGAVLIERFQKPAIYGGIDGLRYRLFLQPADCGRLGLEAASPQSSLEASAGAPRPKSAEPP